MKGCVCCHGPLSEDAVCSVCDKDAPGLGWKLSDETIRQIEEIENNSRMAMAKAKFVLFD